MPYWQTPNEICAGANAEPIQLIPKRTVWYLQWAILITMKPTKAQIKKQLEQDIADMERTIAFQEKILKRKRLELKEAREQLQAFTKPSK